MKYKVGKPHYKLSFIYSFIIIFWAVFLIIYSPFSGMNICGFMLIFLIIFIFLPSMAFCNNIWEVDEHYLKYTFYENIIDKSQAFFKTIFTRNMEYQMKIKLDKIISIQVTYEAVPMLFYSCSGRASFRLPLPGFLHPHVHRDNLCGAYSRRVRDNVPDRKSVV